MSEMQLKNFSQNAREALRRQDYNTVIQLCQQMLQISSKDVRPLTMLAQVYLQVGQPDLAEKHLKEAIRAHPRVAQLRVSLGRVFDSQAMYTKAQAQFDKALKLDPKLLDAFAGRASVYERQNKYTKARSLLAPIIKKGHAPPALMAIHLRVLLHDGETEEAVRLGTEALQPEHQPSLGLRDLYFSVARAHEMAGDCGQAFHMAQLANTTLEPNFEIASHRDWIDSLINAFTPEKITAIPPSAEPSELPVFIVSMPRSGSTLVERIVHSHPQCFGAGEIPDLHNISRGLSSPLQTDVRYPMCMTAATQEQIDTAAAEYLKAIKRLSPRAARITNKELRNYMHMGFAHALLPKARFIHVWRDPMDVCLSCYMERLAPGEAPFTSDLRNLGLYFREYVRLFRHWRQVLGADLLEIDYEDLVSDQEAVSRRIIDFLDLPWEDACLEFHQSKRLDRTLSFDQVRRPMYRSSVGRADRFGAVLDPLREALGPDLENYRD